MATLKTLSKKIKDISYLSAENQRMKDYLNHIEVLGRYYQDYIGKIKNSKLYSLWVKTYELSKKPSDWYFSNKLNFEFSNWNRTRKKTSIDVLIFAVIKYSFRFQRPQHLASQLARSGYRVFYIEPEFTTKPNREILHNPDIKKIATNLYKVNLDTNNGVLTKKKFVFYGEISKEDRLSLIGSINTLLKKAKIYHAVIKVDNPSWTFIVDKFELPIIYDCIDDHGTFEAKADNIETSEESIVKKSTAVTVVSEWLFKKISKLKPKRLELIGNAGDYTNFAKTNHSNQSIPKELRSIPKPILGYCGAITEWFDTKLLETLASTFPSYNIILIGKPDNPQVRELAQKWPNIHLLGEKEYQSLSTYYQHFDVCLIPFKINNVTRHLNPVKIYEYLATGKPIVTTQIPSLEYFRKLIYLSKDPDKFCQNIENALNENDPKLSLKRQQFARENSWEKRAAQYESLINQIPNNEK